MAATIMQARQSRTAMARISLIEKDRHPELADLIARISSGRRGRLLNVYRLLLHSPPLATTWFEHVGAVRWQTQLDGRLREMVIIRIALLNRIEYVIRQHVPELAAAEGLAAEDCDALGDWPASDRFSERERAALAYADAMCRSAQVPDPIFDGLRSHFGEREVVELTVLIGTYIMHTRVFGALEIDLEHA
jgi:4-carboxymuconolactone decarboxylase